MLRPERHVEAPVSEALQLHFRIVMFIFYLLASSALLVFCLRQKRFSTEKCASHQQIDCSISDGFLRQRPEMRGERTRSAGKMMINQKSLIVMAHLSSGSAAMIFACLARR